MTVRWGVLSTAAIAATVIRATRDSTAVQFVAVASRDGERARTFAAEHGLRHSFGSYQELLESPDVDAVYVALPASLHTEWTTKALLAGKHVLCEKPFAVTAADARRAHDAAAAAGRLCVEGFMYRLHPQTELVRRLVADGAIGPLQHMRAALSITAPPGDIRRSPTLGGGSLLDLGCYCVSAMRMFAGEPERVLAEGVLDDDGVDLRIAATLRFPGAVLGQFDIGVVLPRRDELELVGRDGVLVVSDPWLCRSKAVELRRDGRTEQVPVDPDGSLGPHHDEGEVYRIEFERVSTAIATNAPPPFGASDAIAQAAALEAVHAAVAS